MHTKHPALARQCLSSLCLTIRRPEKCLDCIQRRYRGLRGAGKRVRAGLRNARAKGKRLGRPTVNIPTGKVQRLRAQGLSWSRIAEATGVAKATLLRHA